MDQQPMPLPATPAASPERLMQLAWGFAPPLLIGAAVRIGVFDLLASGPANLADVAAATSASPRGIAALLNALVGLDLLRKDPLGRFRLTAESRAYLVTSAPAYHGAYFHHVTDQLMPNWLHLLESVRSGRPLRPVNGEEAGAAFFEQMVGSLFAPNLPAARLLAEHLGVASALTKVSVLDLAAGSAVWSAAMAQRSPNVVVTAVDWSHVLQTTRGVVEGLGLTGQYRFTAGDVLHADLGTDHDIAVLGQILHCQGEAECMALLRRTHAALKPGGIVAIAEFLVDQRRTEPALGLIFAANMLLNTEAGGTYAFEEIEAWLLAAGFTSIRALEAPAPAPLILASRGH